MKHRPKTLPRLISLCPGTFVLSSTQDLVAIHHLPLPVLNPPTPAPTSSPPTRTIHMCNTTFASPCPAYWVGSGAAAFMAAWGPHYFEWRPSEGAWVCMRCQQYILQWCRVACNARLAQ
jgi:hypothetical protein